jgi:dTDP-4-dehydrorhamnose reductase
MNVLVLGVSGMIGRTMFRVLSQESSWDVSGSIRSKGYDGAALGKVFTDIDLINSDHLVKLFNKAKPDIVVNSAGLTKHVPEGNDPISALNMNALLPHRLAAQCAIAGARFIHISTDCVFSGKTGKYQENDETDALDVYGKTKALGEVLSENSITLRTSTIGHEHGTKFGLLEWFLAQQECKGYKYAIFSGLPTFELARIVCDIVIPNSSLTGLYNVGAKTIDKFSLLNLIAKVYKKNTKIEIEDEFRIDRSLDVEKFSNATGYQAAAWPELIESMYQDYLIGI